MNRDTKSWPRIEYSAQKKSVKGEDFKVCDNEVMVDDVSLSVFGIFDGHGNDKAGNYCKTHFVKQLKMQLKEHMKNVPTKFEGETRSGSLVNGSVSVSSSTLTSWSRSQNNENNDNDDAFQSKQPHNNVLHNNENEQRNRDVLHLIDNGRTIDNNDVDDVPSSTNTTSSIALTTSTTTETGSETTTMTSSISDTSKTLFNTSNTSVNATNTSETAIDTSTLIARALVSTFVALNERCCELFERSGTTATVVVVEKTRCWEDGKQEDGKQEDGSSNKGNHPNTHANAHNHPNTHSNTHNHPNTHSNTHNHPNTIKLTIANVGDSHAILTHHETISGTNKAKAVVTRLNEDHRVEGNKQEQARIVSQGGFINRTGRDVDAGDVSGKPLRMWPGGLMMSRTLGDKDAIHASPVPAVKHCSVLVGPEVCAGGGARLVLASDGLWDVLSFKNVANEIKTKRTQNASNVLAQLAVKKAGKVRDDITIIVVDLFPFDDVKLPFENGFAKHPHLVDPFTSGRSVQVRRRLMSPGQQRSLYLWDAEEDTKPTELEEWEDRADEVVVEAPAQEVEEQGQEKDVPGTVPVEPSAAEPVVEQHQQLPQETAFEDVLVGSQIRVASDEDADDLYLVVAVDPDSQCVMVENDKVSGKWVLAGQCVIVEPPPPEATLGGEDVSVTVDSIGEDDDGWVVNTGRRARSKSKDVDVVKKPSNNRKKNKKNKNKKNKNRARDEQKGEGVGERGVSGVGKSGVSGVGVSGMSGDGASIDQSSTGASIDQSSTGASIDQSSTGASIDQSSTGASIDQPSSTNPSLTCVDDGTPDPTHPGRKNGRQRNRPKKESGDVPQRGTKTNGKRNKFYQAKHDLFVGGLPASVSKPALKTHFEQYGKVKHCVLKQNTDGRKSYGFITFAEAASKQRVLDVKKHVLNGKSIKVVENTR